MRRKRKGQLTSEKGGCYFFLNFFIKREKAISLTSRKKKKRKEPGEGGTFGNFVGEKRAICLSSQRKGKKWERGEKSKKEKRNVGGVSS